MSKRRMPAPGVDRESLVDKLMPWGRSRSVEPPPPAAEPGAYIPPSRRTKKTFTAWMDKDALEQLKRLAVHRKVPQQKLIAERRQLFPQVTDVDVERTFEGERLALVQRGRNLVARHDTTCRAHQQLEQIKFHGRQVESHIAAPCLSRREVEPNRTCVQFRRRGDRGAPGSPEYRANPRQKLSSRKRLR